MPRNGVIRPDQALAAVGSIRALRVSALTSLTDQEMAKFTTDLHLLEKFQKQPGSVDPQEDVRSDGVGQEVEAIPNTDGMQSQTDGLSIHLIASSFLEND